MHNGATIYFKIWKMQQIYCLILLSAHKPIHFQVRSSKRIMDFICWRRDGKVYRTTEKTLSINRKWRRQVFIQSILFYRRGKTLNHRSKGLIFPKRKWLIEYHLKFYRNLDLISISIPFFIISHPSSSLLCSPLFILLVSSLLIPSLSEMTAIKASSR